MRYFIHAFGRVVQTVERDPWGGISRTSVKYDRQGNVLTRKESRALPAAASSSGSVVKTTTGTYDLRGRMLSEETEVSGSAAGTAAVTGSVQYSYDELGRPKGVTTGDGVQTGRTYTTQGWQSGKDDLVADYLQISDGHPSGILSETDVEVFTSVSWHANPEKRHKIRRETDVAMLTSVSRCC